MASGGEASTSTIAETSTSNAPGPSCAESSNAKTCRSSSSNDGDIYFNRKWRMELLKLNHIRYCRMVLLSRLPSAYEDLDTQR